MTNSNLSSLAADSPPIDEPAPDAFAVFARTMGIRALARNVSGVVSDVADTGLHVILTKHGRPVAAIVPIGCVK